MNKKYSVLSQSNSWIEGAALEQLEQTANLPYMAKVVGMPDLHPGKGSAVGAAFVSAENFVYPHLIGSDIGCGMSVSILDTPSHKINQSKLVKNLRQLETIELDLADTSLGFVGGGNHFVEIQKITKTFDSQLFPSDATIATIHTGSRGLGAYILGEYAAKNRAAPVSVETELGQWYLGGHEKAVLWARQNRLALLDKLKLCLHLDASEKLDIYHNYLEPYEEEAGQWIHRKGAASAHNALVVIPGSRGDASYIVRPQNGSDQSLYSLAHGAGRKWMRSSCRCKLENRYTAQMLQKTKLGSVVICDDKELLYEEAPEAYKKITSVIDDLAFYGLIEVVAILSPIATYKTANQ